MKASGWLWIALHCGCGSRGRQWHASLSTDFVEIFTELDLVEARGSRWHFHFSTENGFELWWQEYALEKLVQIIFGVPCLVGNDTQVCPVVPILVIAALPRLAFYANPYSLLVDGVHVVAQRLLVIEDQLAIFRFSEEYIHVELQLL